MSPYPADPIAWGDALRQVSQSSYDLRPHDSRPVWTPASTVEDPLSLLRRCTIAVLLTLLALSLGLVGAGSWGTAATYSFFLGAVMLSSWISGLGPGLVATLLGTIAADYFLLAPIHTLTFDASRVVQLSTFVAIAILISSLNDARRHALTALSAAHV